MSKLAFVVLPLVLLCFATMSVMPVQAAAAVVGVSQGNVFEYSMVSHYNSLYGAEVPATLLELNQTQWIRVTVTGVSGATISTRITTHYKNGTEVSSDGSCDVETGESYGGPPFIGANLGRGSLVNPSASEKWYINDTGAKAYRDGSRETNHLSLQYTENSSDVGLFSRNYEYYFDKSTGVLVEYSTEVSYSGMTSVTESKIVSSSVWVIPEFPSFIVLPLLFGMTLIIALATKKKLAYGSLVRK